MVCAAIFQHINTYLFPCHINFFTQKSLQKINTGNGSTKCVVCHPSYIAVGNEKQYRFKKPNHYALTLPSPGAAKLKQCLTNVC